MYTNMFSTSISHHEDLLSKIDSSNCYVVTLNKQVGNLHICILINEMKECSSKYVQNTSTINQNNVRCGSLERDRIGNVDLSCDIDMIVLFIV